VLKKPLVALAMIAKVTLALPATSDEFRAALLGFEPAGKDEDDDD
jgi:hypothetical protein